VKNLLLTALEFAVGFVPSDWRLFALTMLGAVRDANWDREDKRWDDVAKVVASWLRDVMQAGTLPDADVARRMRMASELTVTRELKRLNLLRGV
jgi:hypothetical protein